MTRTEKIHWLENKVFEIGGKVEIDDIPVMLSNGISAMADRLTLFMGEPIMVHFAFSDDELPIDKVSDDGVENLFRCVCS